MTYEEALQLWYSRVNYEQRSPRPSDLKLDRMRALLQRLGNPESRLRIVHVAGSKGKGSVSAMLEAVLRQAGYRTGLFTSPHLSAPVERIQVNGVPVQPEELAELMADVDQAARAVDARRQPAAATVTFFEVATALGFLHFARRRVELAVVEVGLGGRFDSTNVCTPLLAIITSISFDHVQQLGNTLARIAAEKAGIIKPGRPTISGARAPEARAVIEGVCQQRHAPLWQIDRNFSYRYEPGMVTVMVRQPPRAWITTPQRTWPPLQLGLLGEHQAANAAVVVAAIERLRSEGLRVPAEAVAAGLAGVRWPARLEVLRSRPLVLLDCAHNLASARALADTLEASFPEHPASRRRLIFASSTDKDLAGMLALLAPYFHHVYLTRFTSNPRAAAPDRLAQLLRASSAVPFTLCPDAAAACRLALAESAPEEMVCVTGSVFLAGEVRPLLAVDGRRAGGGGLFPGPQQ
jgi:dihydrofolate synthase/folylpolyglutamate synthase